MGDDEHGHAVIVQVFERLHHLLALLRREVPRGLVGKEDRRRVGQRPGDGRALLLASGHLAWAVVEPVAKAHLFQELFRSATAIPGRDPGVDHRDFDVFDRGEFGKEVVVLKDEAEVIPADAGQLLVFEAGEVDAFEGVDAAGRPVERGP